MLSMLRLLVVLAACLGKSYAHCEPAADIVFLTIAVMLDPLGTIVPSATVNKRCCSKSTQAIACSCLNTAALAVTLHHRHHRRCGNPERQLGRPWARWQPQGAFPTSDRLPGKRAALALPSDRALPAASHGASLSFTKGTCCVSREC